MIEEGAPALIQFSSLRYLTWVRPPLPTAAEKESQVLFISDWYHLPEDTLDASYVATLVDTTCTDSVLINGMPVIPQVPHRG